MVTPSQHHREAPTVQAKKAIETHEHNILQKTVLVNVYCFEQVTALGIGRDHPGSEFQRLTTRLPGDRSESACTVCSLKNAVREK